MRKLQEGERGGEGGRMGKWERSFIVCKSTMVQEKKEEE